MIEESLFLQLKKKAADEGRTLQAVANDLLRSGLQDTKRKPYKLRWQGSDGVLQPGVDICDRDKLFDLMDGRE